MKSIMILAGVLWLMVGCRVGDSGTPSTPTPSSNPAQSSNPVPLPSPTSQPSQSANEKCINSQKCSFECVMLFPFAGQTTVQSFCQASGLSQSACQTYITDDSNSEYYEGYCLNQTVSVVQTQMATISNCATQFPFQSSGAISAQASAGGLSGSGLMADLYLNQLTQLQYAACVSYLSSPQ